MKKRKSMKKIEYTVLILILIGMVACENEPVQPKPRGYFRIETPAHEYSKLDISCPFTFDQNTHSRWIVDKKDSCWGDVYYPSLKATLQLTYKDVGDQLETLLKDSQDLAFRHTVKADGIRETQYTNPLHQTYGMYYRIQGDAASPIQFYLTDSTQHFLRGALYFYSTPNEDSLKPVIQYMEEEIIRLMESAEWKNG
jgi:gliding motility-associated lipoprotein GldD